MSLVRIPRELQERARAKGGAAVVIGVLYEDGCRTSLQTIVEGNEAQSIIDRALEVTKRDPTPPSGADS